MSLMSEGLMADLFNQLEEIQNMKQMSEVRETELENQLKIYEEEVMYENKRVEKALELGAMLEAELNQKSMELQALTSKFVFVQKENSGLVERLSASPVLSPLKNTDIDKLA